MTTESTTKPSFGAVPSLPQEAKQMEEKGKLKEEMAVAWKRKDKNGDEYISVKVKIKPEDVKNDEINFKAFKNKKKKDGDQKPDFIGYKDEPKNDDKKEGQ